MESGPTEVTLIKTIKRVVQIKKESTIGILDSPDSCNQDWTGNMAKRHEGGGNIATTATYAKVCKVGTGQCIDGSGLLVISNHTSGEDLEDIDIALYDIFQKPAVGQPKMRLEFQAHSKDVSLSGQLSAEVGQVTSLRDIRVRGPVRSKHTFTLSFIPRILNDIDIQVEIRDCLAGEVEDRDHTGCTPCGPDLYSFHPNKTCKACPENALCTSSTITPIGGFWHSTSKSTQVHECVVKDACRRINRTHDLEEAARKAHKNSLILYYNDTSYKQCADVSLR